MPSPKQALEQAARHAQAGNIPQAEAVCLQIVQRDPRQADAWNFLGVIAFQTGRAAAALEYLDRATAAAPAVAAYRNNRGAVLQGLGRDAEAEAEFRKVLRLAPSNVEANFNLGNVLRGLGRPEESLACYKRAIALKPSYADAYNNMGNVLQRLGRIEEAAAALRKAVALNPSLPEAHNNLGNVLRDMQQWEESAACYRHALVLRPGYVEAQNNLGNAMGTLGRPEEAVACYRQALALAPNLLEAHNNLGLAFRDLGRLSESAACFHQALAIKPDYAEAHGYLGQLLLLTGDYERGWPEYEWRLRLPMKFVRSFAEPAWQGEDLTGRTILLVAEQGLGDSLQFVRFAALVKQRGGTVLFECPPELVRVFQTCPGIDRIVPAGSPLPPIDFQAPLLSLPAILRSTLATVPAAIPYLAADPALVEHWKAELSGYPEFKIGIVWQGNPRFALPECRIADQKRSFPLARFEPVARVPGVRLFSLQKGFGTEQLTEWQPRLGIVPLGDRLNDFADTAAVMMNLDLIISADSSPIHLAGALGRPVWVPLPSSGCWRWLVQREDSPWYPTMRLFRQSRAGEWSKVFDRMAQALAAITPLSPVLRG